MPDSSAGVSLTVAKAFRAKSVRAYWVVARAFCAKAVRAYRAVAKACAPKLCGRIESTAKACVPKLCSVERTGQEAEAKIGVILALCG